MWTAALSLLAGIVALIAWWVKRKRAPTVAEQIQDLDVEYSETIETVHRLRSQGRHADADAVLRRIIGRVNGMRHGTGSVVSDQTERERLGGSIASGDTHLERGGAVN